MPKRAQRGYLVAFKNAHHAQSVPSEAIQLSWLVSAVSGRPYVVHYHLPRYPRMAPIMGQRPHNALCLAKRG